MTLPLDSIKNLAESLRSQQVTNGEKRTSSSIGECHGRAGGSSLVFPCLLPTGSPVPVRLPFGAVLAKMSSIASQRISPYSPFLRQGLCLRLTAKAIKNLSPGWHRTPSVSSCYILRVGGNALGAGPCACPGVSWPAAHRSPAVGA